MTTYDGLDEQARTLLIAAGLYMPIEGTDNLWRCDRPGGIVGIGSTPLAAAEAALNKMRGVSEEIAMLRRQVQALLFALGQATVQEGQADEGGVLLLARELNGGEHVFRERAAPVV